MFFFFFFKQKTAYEMRISDWSSDVCSSDLPDDSGAWAARARATADPRVSEIGYRDGNGFDAVLRRELGRHCRLYHHADRGRGCAGAGYRLSEFDQPGWLKHGDRQPASDRKSVV